jgi:hypothetical protein
MKEKIKAFFKGLWEKFKPTKVFRFLKKWGLQIVNLFFLFVAYAGLDTSSWAGVVVGFWLFLLLAYYIFWKIFGAEKLFEKDETKDNGFPL